MSISCLRADAVDHRGVILRAGDGTRSMFATYIGALVVLVIYFLATGYFRRAEFASIAALLDPFGLSALNEATATGRRMSATSWCRPCRADCCATACCGSPSPSRCSRLPGAHFAKSAALCPATARSPVRQRPWRPRARRHSVRCSRPRIAELGWGPLAALTRFDVLTAIRSPAFVVLLGIAFINAVVGLWYAGDDSVSVIFPVTRVMIQTLREQFTIFPLLIAAFYAGELVWRDRERRVYEIVDATPSSDLAFLLPKILAIAIVLLMMALMSVVAAVCVQTLKGYTHFEFSHYLIWYVLPWLVTMVVYAVLAVFVQMLVPHKFLGLLIILLVLVAQSTLPTIGFEHHLYLYASTSETPISDMNGQGEFARYAAWFHAYWAAFAMILAVLAYALWRRGESAPLRVRLNLVPSRLKGPAGWIVAAAAAGHDRPRRLHLLQHQHSERVSALRGQ